MMIKRNRMKNTARTRGTGKAPRRKLWLEPLEDRRMLSVSSGWDDMLALCIIPAQERNTPSVFTPERPALWGPASALATEATEPVAPLSESEVFHLNSLESASKTIYLDFTGFVTSGTQWNTYNTGGQNIVTPAFDLDGDTASFSTEELSAVYRIWQQVSEDFLPFQVNVTTQDPGVEALRKKGSGDTDYGVRVCIGGSSSDWYGSPAGGVAYMQSFDLSSDEPCFVFVWSYGGTYTFSVPYIADSVSHEVGHTLNLSHDGHTAGNEYEEYYGGTEAWTPIMGSGNGELVQWSKGEYQGATQTEDDLAIIAGYLGYRADDDGTETDFSLARTVTFTDNAGSVSGIIERNTDVDFFQFTSDGSELMISVGGVPGVTNLDVLVKVYRSADTAPIAVYDPQDRLGVAWTFTEEAGTYWLTVEGTGRVTDTAGIYSDYGSLGGYIVTIQTADIITVTTREDVIAEDGVTSLREAVLAAKESSVIRFDKNVFADDGEIVLNTATGYGQMVIDKPITIDASGLYDTSAATPGIIINANRNGPAEDGRIFSISGGTVAQPVKLIGLTLTGGDVSGDGGAILMGGALSLDRCVITENEAYDFGGGIASQMAHSTLTMTNSSLTRNLAWCGGALSMTFTMNRAILTDCIASGNEAGYGGVYYSNWSCGVLTLNNSLLCGNKADYQGGGIQTYGSVSAVNSTLAGNYAGDSGGAFYNNGARIETAFYNCVIARNQSSVCPDIYTSTNDTATTKLYSSLIGDDSTETGASLTKGAGTLFGTAASPLNPLWTLIPTAISAGNTGLSFNAIDWNLTLQATSPCVDTGSNPYLPADLTTDLAGKSRIANSVVDMGAYEYQTAVIIPLASPDGLMVISAGANRKTVIWNGVDGAFGYTVAYSTDQVNWTEIAASEASVTVTGLVYGSQISFKVKTLGDGTRNADSEFSAATSSDVCPMDIDSDGRIGPADRSALSAAWMTGSTAARWDGRADIDGDGRVGPTDRNFLSLNWMKSAASTSLVYPTAKADAVFTETVFDTEDDFTTPSLDIDFDFFN